jgi:1-aminocyclopropane-1-carboxylate deaminase/D-cysteine desulfhydrase-like pyridoxal-dependent ACC family enzyme
MDKFSLGTFPTRLERLAALSTPECELWVKRDDLTNAEYGGNKVRKLEYLLADARAHKAERILTIGAVGSHHVLATALHGARAGLAVGAILVPQPRTQAAVDTLRAGLAAGLEAYPCPSAARVPLVLARVMRRRDYLVPPGGSSPVGSLGYAEAVGELARQIRGGEMPEPEVMVVALGSGGTAAGILAGIAKHGLRARLVGVRVVDARVTSRAATLVLARAVARRIGARASASALWRLLEVADTELGAGYGHATASGEKAMVRALEAGLDLDTTYTAKAFAGALRLVEQRAARTLLYWHTLSCAPMAPLLARAPHERELSEGLRRLFAPASRPPPGGA